jgi:hypothetical protein
MDIKSEKKGDWEGKGIIRCPKCNHLNPPESMICRNCQLNLSVARYPGQRSEPRIDIDLRVLDEKEERTRETEIPVRQAEKISGAFRALRFLAWLELLASIIGATWIGYKYGNLGMYSLQDLNLPNMAISIGVLVAGIFLCILFLVVASIAESLILIKQQLFKIQNKL